MIGGLKRKRGAEASLPFHPLWLFCTRASYPRLGVGEASLQSQSCLIVRPAPPPDVAAADQC